MTIYQHIETSPPGSTAGLFFDYMHPLFPSFPVNPRIAIQGEAGSFHDEAAACLFGDAYQPVCCTTFRALAQASADSSQSDGALMAIENSLAGSILPNYELLLSHKLQIVGEVYLQIRQQLLANPGVTLADVREVHSHPMALQQCVAFLDQHPWKLVEAEDTAGSARSIARHNSKHQAAIASVRAAKQYGLNVLVPDIHTLPHNITRFLLIQPADQAATPLDSANKCSVYFRTRHQQGSLVQVLQRIADAGINLSKLQSFPIPETDWQYGFYADLELNCLADFLQLKPALTAVTDQLTILGAYHRGSSIA